MRTTVELVVPTFTRPAPGDGGEAPTGEAPTGQATDEASSAPPTRTRQDAGGEPSSEAASEAPTGQATDEARGEPGTAGEDLCDETLAFETATPIPREPPVEPAPEAAAPPVQVRTQDLLPLGSSMQIGSELFEDPPARGHPPDDSTAEALPQPGPSGATQPDETRKAPMPGSGRWRWRPPRLGIRDGGSAGSWPPHWPAC